LTPREEDVLVHGGRSREREERHGRETENAARPHQEVDEKQAGSRGEAEHIDEQGLVEPRARLPLRG